MANKRKKLTIIFVALFTVFGGALGTGIVKKLFSGSGSFDSQLMTISSDLNKDCPFMVDSDTRLDNTFAGPGKQIRYDYTLVNYAVEELDLAEYNKKMRPLLLNNYETSPDMEDFRENDVTLIYNYNDKNGIFVTQLKMSPSDFGK